VKVTYTAWDLQIQQREFEIERITTIDANNLLPGPLKLPASSVGAKRNEWTRRKQRDLAATGSDGTKTDPADSRDREIPDDSGSGGNPMAEMTRMAKMQAKLFPFGGISLGIPGYRAAGQIAFTLDSENSIKETHAKLEPDAGGMLLITESFGSTQTSYVEEACRRMAPEHKDFSPEQWASQFPGAAFHPICSDIPQ
jgi:hypothetical protein